MRPLPLYLLLQRRQRRQIKRRRSFDMRLGQAAWIVGLIAALGLALCALVGAWYYAGLTSDLPPITSLPTLLNPDDGLLLKPTRLYDRTGQHLLLTLQDPGAERRFLGLDPQKPDHFSPFLIQAVIGVEEPGFLAGFRRGLAAPDRSAAGHHRRAARRRNCCCQTSRRICATRCACACWRASWSAATAGPRCWNGTSTAPILAGWLTAPRALPGFTWENPPRSSIWPKPPCWAPC